MENKLIASKDNPRTKHITKLLKDKAYRYFEGEYVIEGRKAVEDSTGIKEIYILEGTQLQGFKASKQFIVKKSVFDSISSTENSQGVLAVAKLNICDVSAIDKDGRYVYLDRLQDPGNMGTIIRVAAAFSFNGVIVSNGTVDPFSPKVVRSAAGSIAKINIIKIETPAELETFNVIAADVKGTRLSDFRWHKSFILAIGNEGSGLSCEISAVSKSSVSIPISKKVESLNAAVSCAILLYDATQRSN